METRPRITVTQPLGIEHFALIQITLLFDGASYPLLVSAVIKTGSNKVWPSGGPNKRRIFN